MNDADALKYALPPETAEDAGWVLHEGATPLSYRELRVWKLARELSIEIHRLTLEKLPRFEHYEVGSQIRRAAKSIRANIVEGFGRRRYKLEFLKHLTYAEASCDETLDHLDTLFETGSLADRAVDDALRTRLTELGRALNRFVQAVEREHASSR